MNRRRAYQFAALLAILLLVAGCAILEQPVAPEAVPLLSAGVTNLTSLTLAEDLTVVGASTFAAGSVANAALVAPDAFFSFPVFWSTQITNAVQEVWRTQIPVAFTPYSLTLSAGASVGNQTTGIAQIRLFDDGTSVGLIREAIPTGNTYYQGVVTGTIAASSVFTVEVITTNYGLTDMGITVWGYSTHQ